MTEKLKANPVSMKVHPEFKDDLILSIIEERVSKGMEKAKKPATCCQITKAMFNQYKANPKFKKMLIEVIINGK